MQQEQETTIYDEAMVEDMANFMDLHEAQCSDTPTGGSMPIPKTKTITKAKSAPATPSGLHQNISHSDAMLYPSPANTLPLDIRKKKASSQDLDELRRLGENRMDLKKYEDAKRIFDQFIELATTNRDPDYLRKNFKVYGHRAEANLNLGNYSDAIEDSRAARDVELKWTPAYYFQGRAQFLLGFHADSLAAFAFGLAQDPTDERLFKALVDAALHSDKFKTEFEPKYNKLKALDLDKKPFVVVSVLGQDLLDKGYDEHALVTLESALKMSPDSKRLKGSVLSTISYASYVRGDYNKAESYMEKELAVESELEDVSGQCRVLSNLGYFYYKQHKYDKSIESHRKQVNLAIRTNLFRQASQALNAMGHVHVARNDFTSALVSHTHCLEILNKLKDNDYRRYEELLSIGHVQTMLGDFKTAEERYQEAIHLLEGSRNCRKITEEQYCIGLVKVNFNLAYMGLKRKSFHHAEHHYAAVIELAPKIPYPKGALFVMRAYFGMGQAHKMVNKFDKARIWFEKQLEVAEQLKDRLGGSPALQNLSITHQHFKDASKESV